MNLEWHVWIHYFNKQHKKISDYNIFNHRNFKKDIEELLHQEVPSEEAFAEQVKNILMYYFFGKVEWEIVMTSWPPYVSQEEYRNSSKTAHVPVVLETQEKIDIYQQVMINFNHFVRYLWGERNYEI